MTEGSSTLTETIFSARNVKPQALAAGVDVYLFVSGACGATGFTTCLAKFKPGAHLPYHLHGFSEAVTIIEGHARVFIEGRAYRLGPLDCMHIPAGIAHMVRNEDPVTELVAHSSFASSTPTREMVDRDFPVDHRGYKNPTAADPETIVRFDHTATYELSKGAFFIDLFSRRFGSVGICGGYGRFRPGRSLPCHIHDFDESITIVKGTAICLVEGRQYPVSDCDTAFIPKGTPHRFLNQSGGEMAMIWVYAGSEPDRHIVDAKYCSGELAWPGAQVVLEHKSKV